VSKSIKSSGGKTHPRYAEPPAYPRPFYLIVQLHMEIIKRLERDMKATGITPGVGRVLNAIATRPQISSSSLARMFGIAPQSIKQSVLLLEQRGLISRSASQTDQRVLGAELTAKGWDVRDRHQQILFKMYADVFGDISREEMTELARLLVKVLRHARPSALEYYADLASVPETAPARA